MVKGYRFWPTRLASGIIGRLESTTQDLLLDPSVIKYVHQHKQTTPWATEAGGQLFGSITTARISVLAATGPYSLDERSRYRYRSDSASAQQAIDQQARQGLLYLGEWHSHAEDYPDASGMDEVAMRLILSGSRLNSSALLMLLVSRKRGVKSLGLWSVSLLRVKRWQLVEIP